MYTLFYFLHDIKIYTWWEKDDPHTSIPCLAGSVYVMLMSQSSADDVTMQSRHLTIVTQTREKRYLTRQISILLTVVHDQSSKKEIVITCPMCSQSGRRWYPLRLESTTWNGGLCGVWGSSFSIWIRICSQRSDRHLSGSPEKGKLIGCVNWRTLLGLLFW